MVIIQGIAATKYANVLLCNDNNESKAPYIYAKIVKGRVKPFGDTWFLEERIGKVNRDVWNVPFRMNYKVKRG